MGVLLPALQSVFQFGVPWVAEGAVLIPIMGICAGGWTWETLVGSCWGCSSSWPEGVLLCLPHPAISKGASFQLTSSGLLSILVFLPSGIVVVLLLVRMNQKSGLMKARRQLGYKKSSIEVSEE